jgi:hypothetical protein
MRSTVAMPCAPAGTAAAAARQASTVARARSIAENDIISAMSGRERLARIDAVTALREE